MTKRIFRSIMIVVTAVLLLCFVVIMGVSYDSFSAERRGELKAELSIAAHGVETSGIDWLSGLEESVFRLTLVSSDGTVLYDSAVDVASMENHAEREEIAEALKTGNGESKRTSATLTEETLYEAKRLVDGSVLRISTTTNSVLALAMRMLTPVLLVLAAAIVLSALLARRLSRRIVSPLNALDLEHPLDNESYEELSPLLTRISQQRREIDRQLNELKRRQDEFATVTDNMNEGLVLLSEKGKILSMNHAAQVLFHADLGCIGKDYLTVERGRDIELAVKNALLGGHGEVTIARDGRQVEINTSCILSGGETVGAILLTFDVTEKAQAEQRRREFSANVAHELKTPLQYILGSAELIEKGLVKPEDIPRFTGRIRAEGGRLVTLIDDIIRLSQLDEGGELLIEPVNLLAVSKDAAAQLVDAAAAKNARVTVTGAPIVVCGVRRLLHEIAFNLIDNAIKYNVPGGSVDVTVAQDNDNATLTVLDTGIGIPIEHQSRVFERFYRVDKSHSKATGGTGLGLSIVKHATEAQQGSISLTSEVGKGTKICIRFPL